MKIQQIIEIRDILIEKTKKIDIANQIVDMLLDMEREEELKQREEESRKQRAKELTRRLNFSYGRVIGRGRTN